jgi:thiamine pyrophosphokinase
MASDDATRRPRGSGEVVLRSTSPITLVGGAGYRDEDLSAALELAPTVVAADSGADAALASGLTPELVVGDMDSISSEGRVRLGPRIHEVSEQDTTDFDKVLRAIDAPRMLGVGFMGARLDHELAAMAVLARSPQRCMLVGRQDVVFAAPHELSLNLPRGTRVSLFPMAQVTGRSEGLLWAIDGLDFAPCGRTGTSNEATGRVRLSFEAQGMLVILPRSFLAAAWDALA